MGRAPPRLGVLIAFDFSRNGQERSRIKETEAGRQKWRRLTGRRAKWNWWRKRRVSGLLSGRWRRSTWNRGAFSLSLTRQNGSRWRFFNIYIYFLFVFWYASTFSLQTTLSRLIFLISYLFILIILNLVTIFVSLLYCLFLSPLLIGLGIPRFPP